MADQSAEQIATRQSWKTLPPGPMAPVPYIAAFSQQEYARIRRGLIPVEMEDKWFMFWEADSLFLHRSWTGHCVYRVEFQSSGDRFQVARASISSDNEHHRRGSDQYEAALVDFLIRAILLHQSVEFPVPPEPRTSTPPGLYQHHVAGTAFPERVLSGNRTTFVSRLIRWLRL